MTTIQTPGSTPSTLINQNFPNISTPFVDPQTGVLTPAWQYFLANLWNRTGQGQGFDGGAGQGAQVQLAMDEGDDFSGNSLDFFSQNLSSNTYIIPPAPYNPFPTPELYGAKGDGVILEDGSINAGSSTFNSASAIFTEADTGKIIGILGAGTAGVTLISSIISFNSEHSVNLQNAAVTGVSNAHSTYGTDDAAALTAFFLARQGLSGAFNEGSTYLSSTKQICQLKCLNANTSPLVFLIGNNSDNCFQVIPPVRGSLSQIKSKSIFYGLYLDAMATGLYLLNQNDGSGCFYTLSLDNSYDTAFYLEPVQDPSIEVLTYIENLTGTDWLFLNCGRHGMEVHLLGNGSVTDPGAFCNETNILAWEIRNLGLRFGSGTGATASNAIRFTYDNVATTGISKIEHFLIDGANWDCNVAGSLAGAAIGDVVYINAINGTVSPNIRLEGFQIRPGGIESTGGTVPGPPLFLNGNILATGNWVECDIDQGQVFGWGIGIPSIMLVDPADNNTYIENSPGRGFYCRSAIARPTPGTFPSTTQPSVAIPCFDAAPFGGYIDGAFRNSLVGVHLKTSLVASGSVTGTFAFSNPLGAPVAQDFSQWPLLITICSIPDVSNLNVSSYAEYVVFISEKQSSDTVFTYSVLKFNTVSSNLPFTFNPSAVTFTISGANNESFQVIIPGGASVGTLGTSSEVDIWLTRPVGFGERSRNTAAGTNNSIVMGV